MQDPCTIPQKGRASAWQCWLGVQGASSAGGQPRIQHLSRPGVAYEVLRASSPCPLCGCDWGSLAPSPARLQLYCDKEGPLRALSKYYPPLLACSCTGAKKDPCELFSEVCPPARLQLYWGKEDDDDAVKREREKAQLLERQRRKRASRLLCCAALCNSLAPQRWPGSVPRPGSKQEGLAWCAATALPQLPCSSPCNQRFGRWALQEVEEAALRARRLEYARELLQLRVQEAAGGQGRVSHSWRAWPWELLGARPEGRGHQHAPQGWCPVGPSGVEACTMGRAAAARPAEGSCRVVSKGVWPRWLPFSHTGVGACGADEQPGHHC